MKIIWLFVFIFVASAPAAAQQAKKLRWTTELCEFEGTYDARRYSEAEMRNTLKLFVAGGEFSLTTDATVWKFSDIKNLDAQTLEREYRTKRTRLENLDIVDVPFWEDLRRRALRELDEVYRLSRVTIEAYENPSVIRSYDGAEACVARFAGPLMEGGDSLLAVWREVNEESRRRNGDPQRLARIFDEEIKSPARLEFARVEVMSFGWWNCANGHLPRVEYDGSHEKNFRKLFTRLRTLGCDEP